MLVECYSARPVPELNGWSLRVAYHVSNHVHSPYEFYFGVGQPLDWSEADVIKYFETQHDAVYMARQEFLTHFHFEGDAH
jgi:hypothetical protein